jgi:hypothetical protein
MRLYPLSSAIFEGPKTLLQFITLNGAVRILRSAQGLSLCQAAGYQLMLHSAYVAQTAKPANEAQPRPIRKKRILGGVRHAKQTWQPALRLSGGA